MRTNLLSEADLGGGRGEARPDFGGIAGGGGKIFRGGAPILGHGHLGKLGVRTYPSLHYYKVSFEKLSYT